MSEVFRNWVIILLALTLGLGLATAIGNATSPEVGAFLRAVTLLATAGVGTVDAIKRIIGQRSLLGRGRGLGRLLAVIQLIASFTLAISVLLA